MRRFSLFLGPIRENPLYLNQTILNTSNYKAMFSCGLFSSSLITHFYYGYNVESFKYLGSILTNDGRCTCETERRIAMAKAAFNKKRTLFTSALDLELRKKLVKCYVWSIALYGANLEASGSRSETPGKF